MSPPPHVPTDLDAIVAAHVGDGAPLLRPGDERLRAATSLVLHQPSGGPTELLFIVRADRDGDRWSGHVALPGGKRDDTDDSLEATARRETEEELGFRPPPAVARLARHRGDGRIVTTYLHVVEQRPELTLDAREVAAARWVTLPDLLDPTRALRFRYQGPWVFRGVGLDEHPDAPILWGLTRGTIQTFLRPLGVRLPRPGLTTFRRYT